MLLASGEGLGRRWLEPGASWEDPPWRAKAWGPCDCGSLVWFRSENADPAEPFRSGEVGGAGAPAGAGDPALCDLRERNFLNFRWSVTLRISGKTEQTILQAYGGRRPKTLEPDGSAYMAVSLRAKVAKRDEAPGRRLLSPPSPDSSVGRYFDGPRLEGRAI